VFGAEASWIANTAWIVYEQPVGHFVSDSRTFWQAGNAQDSAYFAETMEVSRLLKLFFRHSALWHDVCSVFGGGFLPSTGVFYLKAVQAT
jgi:hypothetical protein